jgi:hypothetical protein
VHIHSRRLEISFITGTTRMRIIALRMSALSALPARIFVADLLLDLRFEFFKVTASFRFVRHRSPFPLGLVLAISGFTAEGKFLNTSLAALPVEGVLSAPSQGRKSQGSRRRIGGGLVGFGTGIRSVSMTWNWEWSRLAVEMRTPQPTPCQRRRNQQRHWLSRLQAQPRSGHNRLDQARRPTNERALSSFAITPSPHRLSVSR